MITATSWHDLDPVQVRALWHSFGWQPAVYYTLREIVLCRDASPDLRMTAMSTLNEYVQDGLLPVPNHESVPLLLCSTLTAMTRPQHLGWFARRRMARVTQELTGRLAAARTILHAVAQFAEQPPEERLTGFAPPSAGGLLS